MTSFSVDSRRAFSALIVCKVDSSCVSVNRPKSGGGGSPMLPPQGGRVVMVPPPPHPPPPQGGGSATVQGGRDTMVPPPPHPPPPQGGGSAIQGGRVTMVPPPPHPPPPQGGGCATVPPGAAIPPTPGWPAAAAASNRVSRSSIRFKTSSSATCSSVVSFRVLDKTCGPPRRRLNQSCPQSTKPLYSRLFRGASIQ